MSLDLVYCIKACSDMLLYTLVQMNYQKIAFASHCQPGESAVPFRRKMKLVFTSVGS